MNHTKAYVKKIIDNTDLTESELKKLVDEKKRRA